MSMRHSSLAGLSAAGAGSGAVVLTLTGDFDLGNAEGARRWLADAAADHDAVLLDLSRVTWLDSTMLAVLTAFARTIGMRGGRLAIVRPPDAVWEMFQAIGLDELFEAFATRAQANADARFAPAPPDHAPDAG